MLTTRRRTKGREERKPDGNSLYAAPCEPFRQERRFPSSSFPHDLQSLEVILAAELSVATARSLGWCFFAGPAVCPVSLQPQASAENGQVVPMSWRADDWPTTC